MMSRRDLGTGDTCQGEEHVSFAVLFPWLAILIGVAVYYFISRCCRALPYTGVMFIIGAVLGWASSMNNSNAVTESIHLWLSIDGEVIILSFLPGLLFLDSYNVDIHMFQAGFFQLVIFAFPMMLAGTGLTALVAYFIFPYGWSFDLCMTFGSILAATDPVAVAVLLNELGAPPRLKTHISGESLLNDGSAVVLYKIFSKRFTSELGIKGFGNLVRWSEGIMMFLRLSLGGIVIGILFGMVLVILLFNLNRGLSPEENVVQVTTTICLAYLTFFVSEVLCHCSGILSVVFCGLTAKALGEHLVNDHKLIHHFWHIMEHLLNSVLFALGGAVWGGVVSKKNGDIHYFTGTDWAYLAVLFLAVQFIRFILVIAFYPLTKRIGLGANWREAMFMSYSGLRGAVGVSLALLLSAEVFSHTNSNSSTLSHPQEEQYKVMVEKLFGFTGGISFLTLAINGTTCGFFLKMLGLVKPTKARQQIVRDFYAHCVQLSLVEYLKLLTDTRFGDIDFAVLKENVSIVKNVTEEQFLAALEGFRREYPYHPEPDVTNIVSYLAPSNMLGGVRRSLAPSLSTSSLVASYERETLYDYSSFLDNDAVLEERNVFSELLRREFHHQLETGELDSRSSIALSLLRGVDLASAGQGGRDQGAAPNYWQETLAHQTSNLTKHGEWALHSYRVGLFHWRRGDRDYHTIRTRVLTALSFIKAHSAAQETFKTQFSHANSNTLSLAEKAIMDESRRQVDMADDAIRLVDTEDLQAIKSQYCCQLLLRKSAGYLEDLTSQGLLTHREAGHYLEKIDLELRLLRVSSELKTELKTRRSKVAPAPELNLNDVGELPTLHDLDG